MEASPSAHDTLELKAVAVYSGPLVPEQAADFELHLRNLGAEPRSVISLTGTPFGPTIGAFDHEGKGLGGYTPLDRGERTVGDMSRFKLAPPRPVSLGPGQEQTIISSLWANRDPLPPGSYFFGATHSPERGSVLTSNRVPFEIVPAHVETIALGYDNAERANSVLAWLATPRGGKTSRLLVRLSGFVTHASIQVGATFHGDFPPDARVAVSAMPTNGTVPGFGWLGVVSGNKVQLIQHSLTELAWRAPLVDLGLTNAVPVPRFPNRGHAVFLATGQAKGQPVLAGVSMKPGESAPKPWTVRLSAVPLVSACVFGVSGPIAVLFSTDDGKTSRLYRIDVNEDGSVAAPERIVRQSTNEVLSLVADQRVSVPNSFVALEADRVHHDQVAFVKVPWEGAPITTGLRQVQGWPTKGNADQRIPLKCSSITLEIGTDGLPWIAMVDEGGSLFGGRLDGAVSLLREASNGPTFFPHVGALAKGTSISSFNANGSMFHSGHTH